MFKKIRSIIKRATLTNTGSDFEEVPISQVRYLGKTADTEILWPYGFGGIPPVDSVCLVFTVNGDESNRTAIASLPSSRPLGLSPGDVYMSNLLTKDIIKMTENGIEITSDKPIIVNGDVQLGGAGGAPIARVGDSVLVSGSPGTITSGSSNHTAT